MSTNQFVKNFDKVLAAATEEQKTRGTAWYRQARADASRISQETGVSFMSVCGVIAALSPRNKWERNLIDAKAICERKYEHKCSTFNANKAKAMAILDECASYERILEILSGTKVTAFFDNIFSAESQRVTVDVHMKLAAFGKYIPEAERPRMTDKLYQEIENAIRRVAVQYGIAPVEAQGAIWITWKECFYDEK